MLTRREVLRAAVVSRPMGRLTPDKVQREIRRALLMIPDLNEPCVPLEVCVYALQYILKVKTLLQDKEINTARGRKAVYDLRRVVAAFEVL